MHRTILSHLLLVGFLFSLIASPLGHAYALGNSPTRKGKEAQVRQRLSELFELCRARDYVQVASFLVYRGPSKKRVWKDTFNYNNRDEQPQVESVCNRIRDLLKGCEGHEFGEVRVERESEGEWVALEVTFKKGGERTKQVFAFLKVKGKYCLGDIDTD